MNRANEARAAAHGTSVPTAVTEAASRISLAPSRRPTATVFGGTERAPSDVYAPSTIAAVSPRT